jgi:hypothetical protein
MLEISKEILQKAQKEGNEYRNHKLQLAQLEQNLLSNAWCGLESFVTRLNFELTNEEIEYISDRGISVKQCGTKKYKFSWGD